MEQSRIRWAQLCQAPGAVISQWEAGCCHRHGCRREVPLLSACSGTLPGKDTSARPLPHNRVTIYVGSGSNPAVDLTLKIGSVSQQIVVSATGTNLPETQTGASVSVVPSDQFQHKLEVLEPLRQVPGVQVLQTGERGITESLFIRGGESTATKYCWMESRLIRLVVPWILAVYSPPVLTRQKFCEAPTACFMALMLWQGW